ncbi:hypothetical protein MKW98_019359 [Papaver atlanticum]|uniref:Mon2/Sec7/BIG1-like HUS domain-containing protein n=1 Tax=Papaver atlanticum TaxID=357466 RepID=A0AAD4SAR5_9MAGN|nr:hypothetical protein MKW98_019359 [Papaver atlanticum]
MKSQSFSNACIGISNYFVKYATGIFVALLLRFRGSLKDEIAVFFPLIVLRSLYSSDSPLNQRTSVLRILEKVCKDPQMVVDISVNYDYSSLQYLVSVLQPLIDWEKSCKESKRQSTGSGSMEEEVLAGTVRVKKWGRCTQ